jgi:recombinational DNA repair protein (RecF pathway)
VQEYATDAIVLDKIPLNEFDQRVILYTHVLGRITAKIRSGRKITSKLSGHLEPMNIVSVRLIKKMQFQIADALKNDRITISPSALRLIQYMTVHGEPDEDLWEGLTRGETVKKLLARLGFDATHAECYICNQAHPTHFIFQDGFYTCAACAPMNLKPEEYVTVEE